ncbi:hypothetical protein Dimus_012367 [Dionaea muscipula]
MDGEGCENCRAWEEEIYWTHFQTLHFYQILPKDFHQQLVIPKKFTGNMRYKLPRRVSLKGPSGATWIVQLKADGDDLCFLDGWGEFVKACSLKENDLLIFKYNGNSLFDVLMFDAKNLCEKESVYFIKKCGHAKLDGGDHQRRDGKDVVVEEEINGSGSVLSKRPRKELVNLCEKESVYSIKKCGHAKPDSGDHQRRDGKDVVEEGINGSGSVPSNSKRPRKDLVALGQTNGGGVRENVLRAPENSPPSAVDHTGGRPNSRAQPSSSREPNSPMRNDVIEENLANGNEGLDTRIPASVQQNVLEDDVTTPAVTPQGAAEAAAGEQRMGVASSSLIDPEDPFATHRYFKCDVYTSNRRAITQKEKAEAVKRAEQELTDGSFLVVLPPSAVYKRFSMTIPVSWTPKYLHNHSRVVLRMGKQSWATRYYSSNGRTGGLRTGWKKFALENCLEESDVCLFKPLGRDREGIVMDVSIFRVVPEATPLTPVFDF